MKIKWFLNGLCFFCIACFMTGCASPPTPPVQPKPVASLSPQVTALPDFKAIALAPTDYKARLDSFVIILDASNSMGDLHGGMEKFDMARAIVDRLNQTLPEMGQVAGLRTLGHHDRISSELTEMFFGMQTYDTQGLGQALETVNDTGAWSPMANALYAVRKDLEGHVNTLGGVIIVSDGMNMKNTLQSAQRLKDTHGNRICFFPILVGDDPQGHSRLEEIARMGQCGFLTPAERILGPEAMATYVETVFLDKITAAQMDSDGDGVMDDADKCGDTPPGARVNPEGCWTLSNVLFDFDKSVIKPETYPLLDEVVVILEKNPAMGIDIQGHTDDIGSAAYNMGLSMRRANAVADYFMGKGISKDRLTASGFGFDRPVALNGTPYGRSLNRRVELHPLQ